MRTDLAVALGSCHGERIPIERPGGTRLVVKVILLDGEVGYSIVVQIEIVWTVYVDVSWRVDDFSLRRLTDRQHDK